MKQELVKTGSIWFGTQLVKFKVTKVDSGVVHYRPYINEFKNSDKEYFTTVEAFASRFSPYLPKKYSLVWLYLL